MMANPSPPKSTIKSNHERSPICAKFVADHRKVFGQDQVRVIWVREGDFELGTEVGPRQDVGNVAG